MRKLIRITLLILISIIGLNQRVEAHVVQIGYCASCDDQLRLYMEHWHSTETLANTQMQITVTVNGVTTTTTGTANANIQNTPGNQLPGCGTSLNIFASCPGRANNYNDWIAFDFPGVPCGVPIQFTVYAGGNAFVSDACGWSPAQSGTFTIPCGAPSNIPSQTVCVNSPTAPWNFPPQPGITYNWNNNNTGTGLPANGSGNIGSFIAQNNTLAPITSLCTLFTGGCYDTVFSLTVNPAPFPDFTIVPFCDGSPVSFTGSAQTSVSTGAVTLWEWDFDNNGTTDATGQNANYTYLPATGGPYAVRLKVTGANGCWRDTVINITPSPPPTADFNFTNVCDGLPLPMNDASTGTPPTFWNWDIGNNGTIDYTTQNINHNFPGPGTYTVKLVVGTSTCKDSINKTVTVYSNPTADFDADSVCFGNQTCFLDKSAVTNSILSAWQWDFGDGTNNNTNGPCHTYASANQAPGYAIKLVVTSAQGCKDSVIKNIPVYTLPTAAFTATNECLNVNTSITDNSVNTTTYQWNYGHPNGTSNTSGSHTHSYTNYGAGNYTIELVTTTQYGCTDTATQNITIHPMPTADFNFTNVCDGLALPLNDASNVSTGIIANWEWFYGDQTPNGNTQNTTHTYANCGKYNVTLVATSDNGCTDTITKQVEVYPNPVVDFTPTEVCLGSNTQFNDLTNLSCNGSPGIIANWNWNFGDYTPTSGAQNPTHNYAAPNVYNTTLIVTSANGCIDSITKPVTVYDNPPANFVADNLDGCTPVCTNFIPNGSTNGVPGRTYIWNFGDGSSATSNGPSHCYTNDGLTVKTFDVTLTAIQNYGTKQCSTTVTQNNLITVYPLPIANFTWSPNVLNVFYAPEAEFTDLSKIPATWSWDFGDGSKSNTQNPTHLYKDSGNYIVWLKIESQYGCKDSIWKELRVEPDYAIFIPNTFTPDGDGDNDFFFPKGYGIEDMKLMIFDRWGELIFSGENGNAKWDGRVKGKGIGKTDVYVYRLEVKDVKAEYHTYVGKVTLLK